MEETINSFLFKRANLETIHQISSFSTFFCNRNWLAGKFQWKDIRFSSFFYEIIFSVHWNLVWFPLDLVEGVSLTRFWSNWFLFVPIQSFTVWPFSWIVGMVLFGKKRFWQKLWLVNEKSHMLHLWCSFNLPSYLTSGRKGRTPSQFNYFCLWVCEQSFGWSILKMFCEILIWFWKLKMVFFFIVR